MNDVYSRLVSVTPSWQFSESNKYPPSQPNSSTATIILEKFFEKRATFFYLTSHFEFDKRNLFIWN